MPLTFDEIERYERQLILPEWGAAGQERIGAAVVAVRGRGTAALAAVLYLAGAGVRTLRVEAFDGEARALNPHVEVALLAPPGEGPPLDGNAIAIDVGRPARRIAGREDRAAVGAACAVEAVKSLLGLPFHDEVTLPAVEGTRE
jgi:adenylyltransferase/sulfurtransferase